MTNTKISLDIPSPYGQLFEQYECFNELQVALLQDLLHSDKSVVLSAPTGSGKTVAFELAVVRMLQQAEQHKQKEQLLTTFKAIYVAPIKALCAEKFSDWQTRFQTLPVQVLQITGDSETVDLATLCVGVDRSQLIVTTPEKWDSLTRRWRECNEVVAAVRLFMVDEVHLLSEDGRGPILEAIVSRMKTIASYSAADDARTVRFIVGSATIPNIEDLAMWLSNGPNGSCKDEVAQLVFTEMQRPVPLEKHILGFNSKLKGFKFDMNLTYKLPDILRRYSAQKATLIFCNSRKSAEMAAAALISEATKIFPLSDYQRTQLTQLAARLEDNKLRKVWTHGIAFHHAGMTYGDRNLIEESFRSGLLMLLLSTNTLAMGVNLPAHLVIIKSTEHYSCGAMQEYTENTLLQMIGRAGRPPYDTKGVAVIMTHSKDVQKYENLISGKVPVESHLHKHLAEHLNSEISLGTIQNLEVAMNWLRSTYLYVRSIRSPEQYGFTGGMCKDLVERKLEEMCLLEINALNDAALITMSNTGGGELKTTPYGKLMAKYYLSFETMKLFRQIRGNETYLELLNLIVSCKEFTEFSIRVNEKKVLNELNDTPIRFPIKGRIKRREDKISCLIQCILGNLQISSAPGLAMESVKILRIADRVAKCLLEYLRLSKNQLDAFPLGCHKALLHAVTIAKCFHAKLWENSEFASKQLRKIGAVYSSLLAQAGKTTLKSIAETEARTIELILNKSPPFGDDVLQNLLSFPEYMLQVDFSAPDMLQICVQQVNEVYIYNGSKAILLVGDSANNLLCYIENLDSLLHQHGCFEKKVKIQNSQVENIYTHIIHTTLVGLDKCNTFVLNEPPVEIKETASKTNTKRKRQSKLNISTIPKKKKSNNNNMQGADNAIETILFANETLLNKSFTLSLEQFNFSKAKIPSASDKTLTTQHDDELNTTAQDMNDIMNARRKDDIGNEEEISTVLESSVLVQAKVTKYFPKRKYATMMSSSTNGIASDDGAKKLKLATNNLIMDENNPDDTQSTHILNETLEESSFAPLNLTKKHKIAEDNFQIQSNEQRKTSNTYISATNNAINNLKSSFNALVPDKKNVSLQSNNLLNKYRRHEALNMTKFSDLNISVDEVSSTQTKKNATTMFSFLCEGSNIHPPKKRRILQELSFNSVINKTNYITNPVAASLSKRSVDKVSSTKNFNHYKLWTSFSNAKSKTTKENSETPTISRKVPVSNTKIPASTITGNSCTASASSYENACEADLLFWFDVCLIFMQLAATERKYAKFKEIYSNIVESKGPLEAKTARRSSTVPQRLQQNHKLNKNTTSTITSAAPQDNSIASALNTTSSSLRKNPYRLKLFQDGEAAQPLKNPNVQEINQSVMEEVLHLKCEGHQSQQSADTDSALEAQLVLSAQSPLQSNEVPSTFEDFCRLHLGHTLDEFPNEEKATN